MVTKTTYILPMKTRDLETTLFEIHLSTHIGTTFVPS